MLLFLRHHSWTIVCQTNLLGDLRGSAILQADNCWLPGPSWIGLFCRLSKVICGIILSQKCFFFTNYTVSFTDLDQLTKPIILSRFWPLKMGATFFKAAEAVAKNWLKLKNRTTIIKYSSSKLVKHSAQYPFVPICGIKSLHLLQFFLLQLWQILAMNKYSCILKYNYVM